MREYGRVHCAFWTSADVQAMSENGRTLSLYLLTAPHTTIIGAMRLPDGYVVEDIRWSIERVNEGFTELFSKGFCNRCETTKWVWIRKFLDWNQPENPNQWKAAKKVAQQIPQNCTWRSDFFEVFSGLSTETPEGSGNPSPTVSKSGSGSGSGIKKGASAPVSASPSKTKSKNAPESDEASDVYAELVASGGARPTPRSGKVQAAIDAVGGWSAIKLRNDFNADRVRDAFCQAFRSQA